MLTMNPLEEETLAMNSGNRKGIIIVVLSIIVIVSIGAAGIMTLTGKPKGKTGYQCELQFQCGGG